MSAEASGPEAAAAGGEESKTKKKGEWEGEPAPAEAGSWGGPAWALFAPSSGGRIVKSRYLQYDKKDAKRHLDSLHVSLGAFQQRV